MYHCTKDQLAEKRLPENQKPRVPTTEIVNLDVSVILGGDNRLRSIGAAVALILDEPKPDAKIGIQTDKIIIFSGGHTMGTDKPSEASLMYDTFQKRIELLDQTRGIPGGISLPEDRVGLTDWTIRLGNREIRVYLEEEAVDTEDNAKKSMSIIRGIIGLTHYFRITISPVTSSFHMDRAGEAFIRNLQSPDSIDGINTTEPVPPVPKRKLTESMIHPVSAEETIRQFGEKYKNAHLGEDTEGSKKTFGEKYIKYASLKERSISIKTLVLEFALRLASRFEMGRAKIRKITQKRVSK